MNKKEAKQAVNKGKKVTHRLFGEDEYIHLVDNVLCDENYLPLGRFWDLRTSDEWEDNWELYSEPKQNSYIIKRHLIEEYEVQATSREDAKKQATIQGDPYKITVLKETVKKQSIK